MKNGRRSLRNSRRTKSAMPSVGPGSFSWPEGLCQNIALLRVSGCWVGWHGSLEQKEFCRSSVAWKRGTRPATCINRRRLAYRPKSEPIAVHCGRCREFPRVRRRLLVPSAGTSPRAMEKQELEMSPKEEEEELSLIYQAKGVPE